MSSSSQQGRLGNMLSQGLCVCERVEPREGKLAHFSLITAPSRDASTTGRCPFVRNLGIKKIYCLSLRTALSRQYIYRGGIITYCRYFKQHWYQMESCCLVLSLFLCLSRDESGGTGPDTGEDVGPPHHPLPGGSSRGHRVLQAHRWNCRQEGKR